MTRIPAFLRDVRGAMAAEFAMVVPLLIIFLFGILDAGYYAWALNQGEKATQMGTRFAVVTDLVPEDLKGYSFAATGQVPQGTVVPQNLFPTVTCTSATCTAWGHDPVAFGHIRDRMQRYYPEIEDENIQIEYSWSGLGFAGDPNGPDVAPIVTVRLINMQHRPLFALLIGAVDLPDFAYSLTTEDSEGEVSN